MRRFLAVCCSVVLIFLAFTPAFAQNDDGLSPEDQKLAQKLAAATRVFIEIQVYIQKYYYREVDVEKCLENVLAGGLAKCLDPNSSYISPSDASLFKDDISGSFFGIGVELSQDKDGRTIVVSPIEGTPAWHAGIATGDIITHIGQDEKTLLPTKGMTLMEVVKHVRGPKGVPVTLKVLRGEQEKTFIIVRDEIKIAAVEGKNLGGRLGYIRVRQFQKNTAEDFRAALEKLRSGNSCGAVLDFRNNPGGLLDEVLEMANLWSKKAGDIFITEKFRSGEEVITVFEPLGDFRDFPIVILVNGGSASASEIFAGVLQDWGHPVVGVKTYGKGTVQSSIPLQNGGILRLTIAEYLVGNARKPVHGIGIVPNYLIENPEQKFPDDPVERNKLLNKVDPATDPQLKKAVEVLEGLTAICRIDQPE